MKHKEFFVEINPQSADLAAKVANYEEKIMVPFDEVATRMVTIDVVVFAPFRLVVESFVNLLSGGREVSVVGFSSDEEELRQLVGSVQPSVVLLCHLAAAGESQDLISMVREVSPETRILVVTDHDDLDHQLAAVQRGANGVFSGNHDGRMLLRAIRQIHDGDTWFNQKLFSRVLSNGRDDSTGSSRQNATESEELTPREREIISLIVQGMRNKAIASQLFISEATVRHHLSSIYGKLGVENRLNLVIHAYQHGMID